MSHLDDIKAITLFKSFKEMYMYYLKRGFQITTLHVDGEFAALQALIHKVPDWPRVNLESASENVPDI